MLTATIGRIVQESCHHNLINKEVPDDASVPGVVNALNLKMIRMEVLRHAVNMVNFSEALGNKEMTTEEEEEKATLSKNSASRLRVPAASALISIGPTPP